MIWDDAKLKLKLRIEKKERKKVFISEIFSNEGGGSIHQLQKLSKKKISTVEKREIISA